MLSKVMEDELLLKVKNILEVHENNKNHLLAILLEVQGISPKNYISKEVAEFISEQLDISLSRVYDVITFYSALSDEPRGDYIIQICNSTVCKINKYQTLVENLEGQLGIKVGQTTSDGRFTLQYTSCFGACDISPAFILGEEVYGNLTEDKIKNIIDDYRRR